MIALRSCLWLTLVAGTLLAACASDGDGPAGGGSAGDGGSTGAIAGASGAPDDAGGAEAPTEASAGADSVGGVRGAEGGAPSATASAGADSSRAGEAATVAGASAHEPDPCTGVACAWGTSCVNGECVVPGCSGYVGLPGPPSPTVGMGPSSTAVADFDEDGRLDLAVANRDSGDMSVLMGRGDGRFGEPIHYTTGYGARVIVASDLDQDGYLDVVTANAESADLSVFMGVGDGTFRTAMSYETPPGVVSLAAGDLNGDRKPDLLVATLDAGNGRISTLVNRGDGTFGVGERYLVTGTVSGLAMADLDGDSWLDLAVSRANTESYFAKNTMSLMFNDGNGTLEAPVELPTGPVSHFVLAADLDDDGLPDLAVANYEGSGQLAPPNVSVHFNHGGRSFSEPMFYGVGPHPQAIVARDLNGDGRMDLAVAHAGKQRITTLTNQGQGIFRRVDDIDTSSWMNLEFSLGAGDFDGDGRIDLVTTNQINVDIRLNRDEVFDMPASYPAGWSYSYGATTNALAVGDLNGDAKPDIAVAGGDNDIGIMFSRGDGTFTNATLFSMGHRPRAIAIGDLNGDELPDVATANHDSGDVSVLFNAGNGAFPKIARYQAGSGATTLAITDVDDDGSLDLVTAHYELSRLSVMLNRGGELAPPTYYAVGDSPSTLTAADLNGDGAVDLAVVSDNSGEIGILVNRGDGSFQAPVAYPVGTFPSAVALLDVDQDGSLDLLVANAADDTVSLLLNDGSATFRLAANYRVGTWPNSLTTADLNGDQRPDLIVGCWLGDELSVLMNQGSGAFSEATRYSPGFGYRSLAAADLNGDGRNDLAVTDGNNVDVLLNRCIGSQPE